MLTVYLFLIVPVPVFLDPAYFLFARRNTSVLRPRDLSPFLTANAVELGYMSHTARRFFTGKNSCTDGNWWVLSSHHQSNRFSKCHVQRATSTQDGFLVKEGPGLRLAPICVDARYPKGEMFRTIGDAETATVLGLMVVVLSLSISSSLTT